MSWIDRFGSKHRKFGITNIMMYLIATQVFVYIVALVADVPLLQYLFFSKELIFQGEIWRAFTFLFIPYYNQPLSFLIFCVLYYSIGQTLEAKLGTPVFSLYMLLGIVGAILTGFIIGSTTHLYLFRSIFFAYAFFYPDTEIYLFYVLPIKAKYLAYASAIIYVVDAFGAIQQRKWYILLAQAFSLINVFIFFGPSLLDTLKRNARNKKRRAQFERDMQGTGWNDKEE